MAVVDVRAPRAIEQHTVGSPAIWSWWLLLRVPGALSLTLLWPRTYAGREASDVHLYRHWSSLLSHGVLPYRGFNVEYPPGVLPFMALPPLHGLAAYRVEFVAVSLAVDALVLRVLRRTGTRKVGCWMWAVAPLALGPIAWARLDLFVGAAIIAAMLAYERGQYVRAGAWLGFAALLKIWPLLVVLVLVIALRRGGRWIVAGTLTSLVAFTTPVLAWGGLAGLRWMASYQFGRGVQVESVLAAPLFVAQGFGGGEQVGFANGSYEIFGTGTSMVTVIGAVALAVAMVAVVLVVVRRRPAPVRADAVVLAITAAVILTGKVLSPQYLMWAVAAAVLAIDAVPRPRRLFVATIAALVITQLDYPLLYSRLVGGGIEGRSIAVAHALVICAWGYVAWREATSPASRTYAGRTALVAKRRMYGRRAASSS